MNATARRIAVDLNPLLPGGENGGAATATLNLLREIAARGRDVLLLVLQTNAATVDHLVGPQFERYVVRKDAIAPQRSRKADSWSHAWSLTRALGADVLFCPFGDPFWAEDGIPTVCTIHDVQHLDHPEFFTSEELAHRADYLGRLVALADRIVVPSDFTRRTVELHMAPSSSISVVPHPADRGWVGLDTTAPSPSGPEREPFLLYPANAWPHKNHERLLQAMAIHRQRCTESGQVPIRLACTGSLLGYRRALEDRIVELGLSGCVDLLGHVSDVDLRHLYQQARGLIFPSLYEGFGLPVLEAMTFGVPVACSECTALPEVAGDAALFFDPVHPSAIADAVDALAFDDALVRQLVTRGRQRVVAFATDDSVEALLRVLDDAVAATAHRWAPSRASGSATRPTVAVVMPSFGQAPFIGRSIDSVVTQGDVVTKFIVCDGASTDGTVDLLESRRDVLDYVSEPDRGQAAAVNKAIGKATSDIIAWLNSDDVYYAGALAAVATVFAHHPELDWVYFAADHIGPDDEVLEPYYNRPWDAALFRDMCFICQPASFFRSRFFQQVGSLDESLRYCMDYELWFRMSKVQPPVYVPIVTSGSRLHSATKTLGQRTAVLQEIVDMLVRTHGKTSHWWLLGQIGDRVEQRRDWDMTDPAESRRRHRFALAVAARTFLRHRSIPDPATRAILAAWAREGIGRPAPDLRRALASAPLVARQGGRLSPRARRLLSRPYHASTLWIRRRTIWELEPRLQEIEQRVVAGHRAIEELRAELARPAELQLERVVFEHHQVEEAIVERLSAELLDLREELARLQASADGA